MSADPALLAEVLERHSTASPRLREVMDAAVRHLHELVGEVRPSHDEWMQAVEFLTAVGHMSDAHRQEFILLSDTLGVSTLVERLAAATGDAATAAPTEQTVLGPFYVPDAPERDHGASILEDDDPGDRVVVRGTVSDTDGTPVPGARIEVWQNATSGFYAVQQPDVQHRANLRGTFTTDPEGGYEFRSVRPVPYPIPDDGPVGALLAALGRDHMRAGHIHLMVTAPGHRTLVTHLFDAASAHLDDDAVFGVSASLIRTFEPDDHGELAARFDIVLARS